MTGLGSPPRQADGHVIWAASATCCRSSRVVPLAAWTAMPFDTVSNRTMFG
jgi:hypothetical protein